MKVKKFYEPMFHARLILVYDCKARDASEYLEKNNIKTDLVKCSGATGAYTYKIGKDFRQQRYWMFVMKNKNERSTLIHEICHLVFMALKDCGIEIDDRNDETYAYYFEWWHEKIKPFFK